MTDNAEGQLSTKLVDDLLRGFEDWEGAPDIVRLTMKALFELVRAQSSAITDLERSCRTTRAELYSSLSQKVDYSEISQEIADLRSYFENRGGLSEIQSSLNEKVSHSELMAQLEDKVSISQLHQLAQTCTPQREFEASTQDLSIRVDRLQQELKQHMQLAPTYRDINALTNRVDKLVEFEQFETSLIQLEERMLETANQRVAKVESAMARKAEVTDHQRTLTLIASKADQSRVDDLRTLVSEKLDSDEFIEKYWPHVLAKAEKEEFTSAFSHIKDMRAEVKKATEDSKRELAVALSGVKREMESLRDKTNLELSVKADNKETEKILELLNKKSDSHALDDLLSSQKDSLLELVSQRMDQLEEVTRTHKTELEAVLKDVNKQIETAQNECEMLSEALDTVKTQHEQMKSELQGASNTTRQELLDKIDTLQGTVRSLSKQKAEAAELVTLSDTLQASTTSMQRKLQSVEQSALENLKRTDKNLSEQIDSLDRNLQALLDTRLAGMEERISSKAEAYQVDALVEANVAAEDILNLRDNLEHLLAEAEGFATREELAQHIGRTKNALEDVAKDMLLKANVKEICNALDSKANIEEVNQALTEIHTELDVKANYNDFAEHVNEQGLINEALCSENTLGRWIWKGGETRSGHLVPWNIQAVNTCPDNFIWEVDSTCVVVMTPGLYEITFGFYARKKPKVQLLVNGDPVLSAVNNASYVIHHSSGRLMSVTSHPSGNIAGLTLVDFLALPAKAKVSVTYSGEAKVEGFLGFRKL